MIELSSLRKRQLQNLANMILVWIGASFLFSAFQFTRIPAPDDPVYTIVTDPISRQINVFNILICGILIGTIFGLMDNLAQSANRQIRKKSYGRIILTYSILHVLMIFLVIIGVFLISQYAFEGEITPRSRKMLRAFFHSKNSLAMLIYTYIISSLILFVKQVNKKFGPGVLSNMLLGKYHKPKEENCIFMFMDLKSSTTYAEMLGHQKYSCLIQDCFNDLTESVTRYQARIYQYVGDEVVLCWGYEKGIRNANCLKLYYDFKKILNDRSDHYQKEYGLIPQFKAGINGGKIMVAEVGVIKRSIAYHGDVINTASRIQGQCNTFDRELLISEHIAKAIRKEVEISCDPIGEVLLKGKQKKVNIFSIKEDSIHLN